MLTRTSSRPESEAHHPMFTGELPGAGFLGRWPTAFAAGPAAKFLVIRSFRVQVVLLKKTPPMCISKSGKGV